VNATHRLEHVSHVALHVDGFQPRDVRLRAGRLVYDRPFASRELEPDPERLDDQQDVGKDNGGIDTETLDGLQRDLGRGVGTPTQLQESEPGPDGAVLRQVPAGLAHEPDGGMRRGATARGLQEWRVGGGHAVERTCRHPAKSRRPDHARTSLGV
jgi:hypothetical protein